MFLTLFKLQHYFRAISYNFQQAWGHFNRAAFLLKNPQYQGMYLDILEFFLTRCVNALVVPRQGRAGGVWGSDALSLSGNVGVVLDLDGRSQDTPFFQHMMPKINSMKLTPPARPSLLPSSEVKGPAEKMSGVMPQNLKISADLCCAWWRWVCRRAGHVDVVVDIHEIATRS